MPAASRRIDRAARGVCLNLLDDLNLTPYLLYPSGMLRDPECGEGDEGFCLNLRD